MKSAASPEAVAVVEAAKARFVVPIDDEYSQDQRFVGSQPILRAPSEFGGARPARVAIALAAFADGPMRLRDTVSGVELTILLNDALPVPSENVHGYVVHRGAHKSGADLIRLVEPSGVEDYFVFESKPDSESISYDVHLDPAVGALRVWNNIIELIDHEGVPRLRVAQPLIIGADGVSHAPTAEVLGCVVDRDPRPPWGRRLLPPRNDSCRIRVSWQGKEVVYPALLDPTWQSTANNMTTPRFAHTATLLDIPGAQYGKVLLVGGVNASFAAQASAELYDPGSNTFSATGSFSDSLGRYAHTAVRLSSGKVLVSGGALSTALNQIYDPATGLWSSAGNYSSGAPARQFAAAVLLPALPGGEERVLVAGGFTAAGGTGATVSSQIYTPSTNSWTAAHDLQYARGQHTMNLIPDIGAESEIAMVVGGQNSSGPVGGCEVYIQTTNTWSSKPSMPHPRYRHGAVLLAHGKLLVAGGTDNGSNHLSDSSLYDPAGNDFLGAWTSTDSFLGTYYQSMVLLDNGMVFVYGGLGDAGILNRAQIFDPAPVGPPFPPYSWLVTGSSPNTIGGRYVHTATKLLSGTSALLAGGGTNNGGTQIVSTAEVFSEFPTGAGCGDWGGRVCASGVCKGTCQDTQCAGGCQMPSSNGCVSSGADPSPPASIDFTTTAVPGPYSGHTDWFPTNAYSKASDPAYTSSLFYAVANAQPGDEIILDPAIEYRIDPSDSTHWDASITSLNLPYKSQVHGSEKWILIRSNAEKTGTPAGFPGVGNRILKSHSSAGLMPKIVIKANNAAITTTSGTNHSSYYWFIGIEVQPYQDANPALNARTEKEPLVTIGNSYSTSGSQQPDHIVFDRCFLHGLTAPVSASYSALADYEWKRGILANGTQLAIVNSRISEIHTRPPPGLSNGPDAQAIVAWNTPGRILIKNNYLAASTESVLLGGDASCAADGSMIPADIEIRNNHFHKPLSWKKATSCNESQPDRWWVKNHLEFKVGIRILVDGNYFENSWGGRSNCTDQDGGALGISPRNQVGDGECVTANPWSVVRDVVWSHNWVVNAGRGLTISGDDDQQPTQQTSCVVVENNVFYGNSPLGESNPNKQLMPDSTWSTADNTNGRLFAVESGIKYGVFGLQIRHNTGLQNGAAVFTESSNGPDASKYFVFQDNIVNWQNGTADSKHGVQGIDAPTGFTYGEGLPTFTAYYPSITFRRSVIINTLSDLATTYGTPGTPCDTDIMCVFFHASDPSASGVRFNSLSGEDFHLQDNSGGSGSPYWRKCTHNFSGTGQSLHDIGAYDWSAGSSSVGLDRANTQASSPSDSTGVRDPEKDN